MRINAIPLQKTYYNDKRSKYNTTNFTGSRVNGTKLRKLASASILTSAGMSTTNLASGGNELLSLSGLFLFAMGGVLDTVCLFLKNGERLKLQKHIDFFKAQNAEQAANFAEQNFKIKYFDVKDLDTANWINKGLTKLSNRFQGETYMPSNISLKKFKNKRFANTYGYYRVSEDMIAFNQNLFDEIDNKLELVRIGLGSKIKELSQALPGREDNFSDIIQRYIENPKSLTKPQKVALYLALIKKVQVGRQIMNKPEVGVKEPLKNIVKSPYKKDLYRNIQYNEFGLLYHEMGHMMHYKELSSVGLISKRLANISHFKKEVKQMTIPSYSKTSQLEFVAETIAGMLNGDVYSQQIMDLFNKLTNVRIPEK